MCGCESPEEIEKSFGTVLKIKEFTGANDAPTSIKIIEAIETDGIFKLFPNKIANIRSEKMFTIDELIKILLAKQLTRYFMVRNLTNLNL